MFDRVPRILSVAVIAAVMTPSIARGECIRISPKQLVNAPGSELVFAGDVAQVIRTGEFGAKATFKVRQVWKGNVRERFEVFMWDLASAETPRYEEGKSYVVAAKSLLDQKAREGVGLADSQIIAFAGMPCSGDFSVEEFVRGAGPGKPPTGEAVEGKNKR